MVVYVVVLFFLFICRWYKSIFKLLGDFYEQMINPMYSAVTDVYAFMFICDLITFLITVFGYASFGPSVSSFASPDDFCRKYVPYILACKSQNLRLNLDQKVGGRLIRGS